MIEVKADQEKQRLAIVADGALNPNDFQQIIKSLEVESGKLDSGWVAAVNFKGMRVEDHFLNEQLKLLQEALLASGACRIGTLLDNQNVLMRLSQTGMETHSNAITQRFTDEKKWEAFLSHA
jgi:hypothetical protein